MSLGMLEHLLKFFLKDKKIIGVDICGECQIGLPFPEYIEAEEKTRRLILNCMSILGDTWESSLNNYIS